MVELTIDNTGKVFIEYNGEKSIKIDFIGKDLNTGLGRYAWWTSFPEGNNPRYTDWGPLENWTSHYTSGIEVFGYVNGKLIFQKTFQTKKLNNKYYFSSPSTEKVFASWESLMYGNKEQILLNPNDVVYDLGANCGVYTMWALSQNVQQVYSFEPTKYLIKHLKETFKWDDNVEIIEKAISDKNEIQTFYTFPHSVSNSLFYNSGNPTEVECIYLEEYIKKNNLIPPTIIKCDIEGAEYKFIESCSDEFLSQLRGIFLEYHLGKGDKVWSIVSRFLDLKFNIKSQGAPINSMGTLLISKD